MVILNPTLIEKQKLSPKDIDLLESLHFEMNNLKNLSLEEISDIDEYITQIENLEYDMQEAWKFDRDSTYHTHWFTDPKCTCPKLDNYDLQGIDRKIISLKCPLHGDKKENNE